jgi:hypothetical protein
MRELEANTHLEDPGSVGDRVTAAAGVPAGIKAKRNQEARIETQTDLTKVIAQWAGIQRYHGISDRMIHKKFFIDYSKTISEALSEPKKDMLKSIDLITEDLAWNQ